MYCHLVNQSSPISYYLQIFKDFIYLFLDKGKGREKEERNINVWLPLMRPLLETHTTTLACVLTGNRTCNPLVCRLVLSPLSDTSQGYNVVFFFKRSKGVNYVWSKYL